MKRREVPRFNVNGKAIAIFKPHPILMGQVIDISMGGLAFHYHQYAHLAQDHCYRELELICSDGTRLEGVPYEVVFDIEVSPGFSPGSKPLRRAGIRFGELTKLQAGKLMSFIDGCQESNRLEAAYYQRSDIPAVS